MNDSSMNPILQLRNVSYSAGETEILREISWSVDRGEHWAILGRNGSGKTTLLRIACGWLWPNAGGEVLRCGLPMLDLRELRRSIGWVNSAVESRIPPREKAIDTVVSGRFAAEGLHRLANLKAPPETYSTALKFLKLLNMEELAERSFGVLSQGEKQKTLLARARMADPLLLILDEPCAGLDPASREAFLSSLASFAQAEDAPSMVIVTHHVEEILPIFENLLVLREGRIIRQGSRAELLTQELANELYDGAVTELIWRDNRCWPVCGK